MKANLKNVKEILEKYPITRSSDKALVFYFMLEHTSLGKLRASVKDQLTKAFKEAPSFESITRRRREIQSTGELMSNAQVKKDRANLEKRMRQYYK